MAVRKGEKERVTTRPDFWRWQYFRPEEVMSPVVLSEYKLGIVTWNPYFLDVLEFFRSTVGYPLIVNFGDLRLRGFRSIGECLKARPGCNYSFHLWCAVDVSSPGIDVDTIRNDALISGQFGGIGTYRKMGFVHLDGRPRLGSKPIEWEG